MIEQEKNENNSLIDKDQIFSLEKKFPDLENIFNRKKKILVNDKDTIIFIDTNVLLLPFTPQFGMKSLLEIEKIYNELKNKNKIFITDRIAREFIKNKDVKLAELLKTFSEKENEKFKKIDVIQNIFMEEDSFDNLNILIKQLNEKIEECKKEYNKMNKKLKLWEEEDPITKMYSKIFNKKNIVILDIDNNEIVKEWELRKKIKSPPGYRDSNKDDSGIGDFLIWKTMIQLSKEKKKNVIFISEDKKNDWYTISNKAPFSIKPELVNEFYFETKQSINLMSLSQFISNFEVNKETIETIENIENDKLLEQPLDDNKNMGYSFSSILNNMFKPNFNLLNETTKELSEAFKSQEKIIDENFLKLINYYKMYPHLVPLQKKNK